MRKALNKVSNVSNFSVKEIVQQSAPTTVPFRVALRLRCSPWLAAGCRLQQQSKTNASFTRCKQKPPFFFFSSAQTVSSSSPFVSALRCAFFGSGIDSFRCTAPPLSPVSISGLGLRLSEVNNF
ncbi:hypothetical protein GUJ93_ZPchr0012g19736 [Zizania palustris]|uniref:Uncharacterized protein n=1 Tax=Zizania palustris TaxID=103762 RepID=A0A8J5WL95_ZIZPA|nr:hypothetical protein GUJ93_ZPchr0012g19736 [Zizania palustris]